ncbi:ATP-binding domain-containing protein [Clostridium sp.]|uniref:ATP-dependent DNA helicase n=1 Tax=Clostridium sp. TaxID=1506 RepID=UPI002FCBDD58
MYDHCGVRLVGTGKSTLIKYLLTELKIDPSKIGYACYTGKASLVLQRKGHEEAMTLHRLLYKTFKNKDGTFSHIPKEELSEPYEILIFDEVSMIPTSIWNHALKYGVHIIALGDPFQLPALYEENGILDKPHVFLTEVMRQALDSEIIKISMDVRNGVPLKPYDGKEVKIIEKHQLVSGMYTWADQIICGTNATRRKINAQMRELLGYGAEPQEGDKIICLKNYWNELNEYGDPLINGMIGTLSNVEFGKDQGVLGKPMMIDFTPDFINDNDNLGMMKDLSIDYKLITEGNPTFARDAKPIYQNGKKVPFPKEFDYGYCITTHKSQGSEYNNVLLFTERFRSMTNEDYQKALYTGITRASSKIVIVL